MLKNCVIFVLTLFAFTCLVAAAPETQASKASADTMQETLTIIKPNAVKANKIGAILNMYEENGLQIKDLKLLTLTKQCAEQFYAVHKDRSFYDDLVAFMTSGPVVAIALKGPDAVAANRKIMGATDPAKAAPNTIRAKFGENLTANAVHGSDSAENAKIELDFFFGSTAKCAS